MNYLDTKEYVSLMCLQAIITSNSTHIDGVGDPERLSVLAVKYAKALMAETAKEQTDELPY